MRGARIRYGEAELTSNVSENEANVRVRDDTGMGRRRARLH